MTMMDFNDPNEPWRQTGFDPYKGMSLKERQQAGCIHGVLFVVAVVVLIIIAALCHGCTTKKRSSWRRCGRTPCTKTTCSTTQSIFVTLYG